MQKVILAIAGLLSAGQGFSTVSGYRGQCLTGLAQPAAYCQVNIHVFASGELARVYANSPDDGLRELTNPVTADSAGIFAFHAEPGVYEIRQAGGSPPVEPFQVDFAWLGGLDVFEQPSLEGRLVFDIVRFGATAGDDSDDDLPAIQAAINAANGGGVVYIPEGVFDVVPAGRCQPCIELTDDIAVVGAGAASVIRVRAGAGAFDAVFSEGGKELRNVAFAHFSIDGNITNNPGTVAPEPGRHAYLIRLYAGRNIWITGMRFLYSGVNAVTLNGEHVSDVWMLGNSLYYNPDTKVPPYDNTAIYTNGYRVVVAQNTIQGRIVSGMPRINGGAIGGIELHGGPALALRNRIIDTRMCLGVVSGSATSCDSRASNDIAVLENTCENVNEGVVMVSIDGKVLRNVAVARNYIEVAQTRWNQHSSSGIELLWLSKTISGDFERINIARNVIRFEEEGHGGERAQAVLSNIGIGLGPAGNVRQALVAGNLVTGAPLMAVRAGNLQRPSSVYDDVIIAGNVFVDYGQNKLANPSFRLGIRAEGRMTGLAILHNRFERTRKEDAQLPGIYMVPEGTVTRTAYNSCRVLNNAGAEPTIIAPSCRTAASETFHAPPRSRGALDH